MTDEQRTELLELLQRAVKQTDTRKRNLLRYRFRRLFHKYTGQYIPPDAVERAGKTLQLKRDP